MSSTARWFEQAVKIPSSINTILVLTIVSYSLQHSSSFKGNNKAHSIDFERLLQSKHPCLLCLLSVLNGKLANYDVTKSSSGNFPTFPRTVPFVRRRKRVIFNVEYLGDVLMKSCKTLDYDYLDYNLLSKVKSQNQKSKSNQAQFRCIWPLRILSRKYIPADNLLCKSCYYIS